MKHFETVMPYVEERCRRRMTQHMHNVFTSVSGHIDGDEQARLRILTGAVDDWWFSRIKGSGDLTMIADNLDLFASHAILLLNEKGFNRRLNYKPLFPPAGQIALGLSSQTDSTASTGDYGYWVIYMPIHELEKAVEQQVPYGHSISLAQGAGRVLGDAMFSLMNEVINGHDQRSLSKILPGFTALMANALQDPEAMELYSHKQAPKSRRIVSYLQCHFANPDINPELVAEKLGMSRRQLDRECARLGNSFNNLLRDLRLHRAAHLLLSDPTVNITHVSYEVGFSSPTVFGRLFKQAFTISPRQYALQRGAGGKPSLPIDVNHLGINLS